ncbi:MAG: hypothetical protein LIO72_06725 [Ruminococcus sp.]|nr:hypothetical protein [Ruminococcus sp.]
MIRFRTSVRNESFFERGLCGGFTEKADWQSQDNEQSRPLRTTLLQDWKRKKEK